MDTSERILDLLRTSSRAWTDDELAEHLGIGVVPACHRLAAQGRLRRHVSADGRLVNQLVGLDDEQFAAIELIDSNARMTLIEQAGARYGVTLRSLAIVAEGAHVEIHVDSGRTVVAGAWAHHTSSRDQVLAEALKLSWVASTFVEPPSHLVLCFADEIAADPFLGERSWVAAALRHHGIEVFVASTRD